MLSGAAEMRKKAKMLNGLFVLFAIRAMRLNYYTWHGGGINCPTASEGKAYQKINTINMAMLTTETVGASAGRCNYTT